MTTPDDFTTQIRQIHARRRLVVDMELTPRGRTAWTATLSGEDFLDGDWSETATGVARGRKAAMRAVRKRFE